MNYDFFKNTFLRKTLASWCAFATLVTMCGPAWAISGALDSGSAALTRTSDNVGGSIGGTTGNFNLTSGTAGVLDWSKLSLNSGETLNYNSAGSFYNVVNSAGGMSTIAGAINGVNSANVYIFNPNGIVFNAGSSVDVGGIFGALATGVSGAALTSWMANPTDVPAAIKDATMTGDITVNGGTFSASQIAFAGKNVSVADGAKFNNNVSLAAGDKVTIDGFSGGKITLTIPDTAWEGDVDMLGQFADNLEAMAAGNVRAANGTLTVAGDLKVNTYGDIDVQPGAFVVNNAEVSAKSIEVTALGDVSVVGKTDLKTTAGDLKLTSQKGQTYVLGTASGEAASIQATAGDLMITAAKGIAIGEHGVITATKTATESKGNVILTANGKDDLSGDGIQVAGAGAKVSGDNGVTLTANDGNVTIKDGSEIASVTETKIQAMKGAISEDATSTLLSKGVTYLKAKSSENITLEGAANKLEGKVIIPSAAKDVKIVNDGDLTINQATAEALDLRVTDVDAMSVKATDSITAQKIVVQKSDGTANAVLEQSSGTITVTGTDGITAKTVKQTASSTIKTDKITGDFEQAETVRYATLSANTPANGLTITGDVKQNKAASSATATIGGTDQNVTIEGALTQTKGTLNADALVLKGGANQGEQGKIAATSLDLQGAANDFTLLGAANAIKKIGTSLPAGVQNVQVKNATALEIGKTTASGNFIAETADGAITVSDAVTAGKNLRLKAKGASADVTIAADKAATATKNVTVKAGNKVVLADGAKLEAKTESVYVESVGNVELGKSAVVSAGADALADSKVANVLVRTTGTGDIKGMSNVATEYGTIKAGGAAKGAVVLDAAGSAGENLTIEASDIGFKSKNDITVNVEGDTTLSLKSTEGNINVNHKSGTLTIDSLGGALADAKVNEVKADGTLLDPPHALSDYAADFQGLTADKAVNVTGTDNSALAVKSIIKAGTDVGINVDKGVTIDGLTADTTLTTKGITAGKTITVKADGEDGIKVSGGTKVSATGTGISSWKDAVTLEATAGTVDVSGENTLVKTENGGALLKAGDSVKVSGKAQVDVKNTLAVDAGDKTAESGIAITDAGTLVKAGSDVNLTAAKGDVVLTAAKIKSDSGVYMTASDRDVKVNGTIEDWSSTLTAAKNVTIGAGAGVSGYSHHIEANKVTVEGGAKITETADENVAIDLIATGTDGSVIVKDNSTLVKAEDAGTLQVTSSKDVFIQDGAKLDAGGNLTMDAADDAGAVTIQNGATVASKGALTIDASGDAGVVTIQNGATVSSKGDLTVGGAGKPATLTVQNGATVKSEGDLVMKAKNVSVQSSGTVQSDGALGVTATDILVQNGGRVEGMGGVNLTADNTLMVRYSSSVKAGTVDPYSLVTSDSKDLTLDAKTILLDSGGNVSASGDAVVSAKDMTVSSSRLVSGKKLTIDAKTSDEGAFTFNSSETVADKGAVTIGTAKAPATLLIQNGANISSKKDALTVKAGAITAQYGSAFSAEKNLTIDAASITLDSAARVVGNADVLITADDAFAAKNSANVKAGSFVVNPDGTLQPGYTTGNLKIESAGTVAIESGAQVGASGAAAVTGANGVTVNNARLVADKNLTVKTTGTDGDVIIKSGAFVGANNAGDGNETKVAAEQGAVTVDSATLAAKKDLTVTAKNGIEVKNANAKVASDKKLTLIATDTAIDIKDGAQVMAREALTLDAKTDVTLDAAVVEAQADVAITARDGKIEQTGDGHVTVGGVATLKAAGDITLANAENDFADTVSAEGVNVSLTDKNNIKLGTVLAQNGELNVMALNGSIKQMSDGKVTVGKEANLTAEGGDVNLQNWRNDFQGRVNATTKDGNVRIRDGVDDVLVGTVVAKKNAVIQSNVEGGKVIADGETSMTANSVSLNSQLGDVSVTGGATLMGETDVSLTAGNDVTVGGAGTMLAGKEITVYTEERDIVIEDEATLMAGKAANLTAGNDLTIREDAVVIARGKNLEAGETTLTLKALEGSIAIDDTTGMNETLVTAKGDVEMTAKKDVVIKSGEETGNVQIESYGTLAARAETGKIEIHNAVAWASKDLTLSADRGDVIVSGSAFLNAKQDAKVVASEGAVTVADLVQVGAGRDVIVMAKNDVSVQDRANVFASRSLSADATTGELTIGEAAKVGAQSNMRLAAGDDTTINSAVAAGKNLTVIGQNVRQNADFTAQDGSVYVEATGGDIVMKAGTVTTAGKAVAGTTEGQGNVLYTATGDVRAEAGGATVVADPTFNDGAIVLSSESGSIGENMTLKAARVGAAAKGDVKTHLVGDVTFGVTSLDGSITIDHEAGTLTVDKSMIGANDKAVKVLSATETELIGMTGRAGEGRGLDAATFVNVTGHDGSTVVVDSEAGIFARNGDATVTVDRDIRVDGTVEAGNDQSVVAGGNLATPGKGRLVAGRDLSVTIGSSTPQINVAVGKGISARSGERAIAFKTVGGSAYPEVYGNDSKTAVFIDGRIAGGNSADFSILQGYEQAAAFGNAFVMPVFTRAANFFPLTSETDMQAPEAAFTQGYLFSSEKGEVMEEADEQESPEISQKDSKETAVQTASL